MTSYKVITKRDLQWALGINRFTTKLLGLWADEGLITRDLHIPVITMLIITQVLMPQSYALTRTIRNLGLAIDNLIMNVFTVDCIFKLSTLWRNRKLIRGIVTTIINDWSGSKLAWEYDVMRKHAKRAKNTTILFYFIELNIFTGWLITPMFGHEIRGINNYTDLHPTRRFPLQTLYPFDCTFETPYFQILLMLQIVSSSFTSYSLTVTNNFLGTIVYYANSKCEILERKIERFASSEDPSKFQGHLKAFVDEHLNLIKVVDEIERAFSLIVLVEIVCLSLAICFSGFNAIRILKADGQSLTLIQNVTLVATSLNLVFHMFIYFLPSELLTRHSLQLGETIYNLDWYNLSAKFTRDLTMIMIRSYNSPLQLSAGKFFILSFPAFFSMTKSAFGYISVLMSVDI